MSESVVPLPESAKPEFPTPYSLEDFPEYQAELARNATTHQEVEAVAQTFDPKNVELLKIITDPEFSSELSGAEHEAEFQLLYPALDQVLALHEQATAPAERSTLLRSAAVEASHEALQQPGSYLVHWDESAAAAGEAGKHREAQVFTRNSQKLKELQGELLNDKADASVAAEVYLHMGALTKIQGSEDVLVYAANLPLAKEPKAKYPYGQTEQVLMGGAMLSEASLLNERYGDGSLKKQHRYEAQARQKFEAIIEGAKTDPSAKVVARQARVYVSDLDMREAHRLAVEAVQAGGNDELMGQAKDIARGAIADLQECILEAKSEMDSTDDPQIRRKITGELVERAILLLLRRHALDNKLATEMPYQAFPRQDYPKDGLAPAGLDRQSYDVVQTRYKIFDDGRVGQLEVPIQAKNRRINQAQPKPGEKPKTYDPRVVLMANFEGQVADIIRMIPRQGLSKQALQESDTNLEETSAALVRRLERIRAVRQAPAQ